MRAAFSKLVQRSEGVHFVGLAIALLGFCSTESFAATEAGARKGPPFPRIASLYSTWLNPDSAYVTGLPASMNEAARCDLLVGVGWPWANKDASPTFCERLAELKALNPPLIALDFSGQDKVGAVCARRIWRCARSCGLH